MLFKSIFLIFGTLFGFVLIRSGVSDYDVIREMFLLKNIHLYGVLGVAVGLGFLGTFILKKIKAKPLAAKTIDYSTDKLSKRHLTGGLIAGLGWALTGACPGPALAQIGFGALSGIFIVCGVFIGIYIFTSQEKSK